MSASSLTVYITKSCPFCDEFLEAQAPRLFTWLVESTIPYELIEASTTYLKEIGVTAVPCIVYNNTVIDPSLVKFTYEEIIRMISTPRPPTFSGIPGTSD